MNIRIIDVEATDEDLRASRSVSEALASVISNITDIFKSYAEKGNNDGEDIYDNANGAADEGDAECS